MGLRDHFYSGMSLAIRDKQVFRGLTGSQRTPRVWGVTSETVGICMFFEAPSIGCRKTTCDVTKVTYNMYSCDTCCMSRERMEMDGRDNAMCQNPREGTWMTFLEFLMITGQKSGIVVFFLKSQKSE